MSAGIGASAIVGGSMRRFFRRREIRQREQFTRDVNAIVDRKLLETRTQIIAEIRRERRQNRR